MRGWGFFVGLFAASLIGLVSAQAPTSVLNPASDLAGKTLVTAEGNRTITGTFTWSVPVRLSTGTAGAPGLVSSADQTTGLQLSLNTVGASIGGTQRLLLNAAGLTVYGQSIVANTGLIQTAALGSGSATSTTFLRGDQSWVAPPISLGACDLRLSASGTIPVTTNDQTALTSLFVTPVDGGVCSFHDGSASWNTLTNSPVTLTVPSTSNTGYDVFCYNNTGTIACEMVAWPLNGNYLTSRTALTRQNAVLVKTGDTTRRYIGSFRTTTTSGQAEDSAQNRYVWSYYRPALRPVQRFETTANWTYNNRTVRQANASASNQVDTFVGWPDRPVHLALTTQSVNAAGGNHGAAGFCVNSTTSFGSNQAGLDIYWNSASLQPSPTTTMDIYAAIGRQTYVWCESVDGSTTTWYANFGLSREQSGINGWIVD